MGTDSNRRIIIHIDMDAFFASVEQQCNTHYRNRPVAVTGANKRTVVTTASYEARKFSVKTGMTKYEAKKLCPEIVFVAGNNEKYTDTSVRIISILKEFSNKVEVYSIDESFLDLTGHGKDPVQIAKEIKNRIKKELGLTCSIGIGPNKLIAKLASGMNKPDGLTVINDCEMQDVLEKLPVEELCGIGKKTAEKLLSLRIRTCGELGRAPASLLRKEFGIIGEILVLMGQGIDNSPVVPLENMPGAKSIGHSMTLEKDETDSGKIKVHLLQLSEMVGRRLRRENMRGRTICLVVRYNDFYTFRKQKTIRSYINETKDIYSAVLNIFDSIKLKKPVRLLGVSVSSLTKDLQQPLFEEERIEEKLTKAVDKVNDLYGEFTVAWASLLERFHHKNVISPSWRPLR